MEAEFVKALLALRSEIGPVLKGETAKGKDGKAKYKYPDLAGVHGVIDAPMAKHGFIVFHRFQEGSNGEAFMETHLVHEKGEIVSTLPLWMKQLEYMNFYQSMGSAITYLRRYAIMALLGIPAEDDDSAGAAHPKGQDAKPPANGNGQKVKPKNTGPDAVRSWANGFIKALKDCRDRKEAQAGVDKVSNERWEALKKNNPAIYAEVMNAVQYSMETLPDEVPAPGIAAE